MKKIMFLIGCALHLHGAQEAEPSTVIFHLEPKPPVFHKDQEHEQQEYDQKKQQDKQQVENFKKMSVDQLVALRDANNHLAHVMRTTKMPVDSDVLLSQIKANHAVRVTLQRRRTMPRRISLQDMQLLAQQDLKQQEENSPEKCSPQDVQKNLERLEKGREIRFQQYAKYFGAEPAKP